jgi:hypothetical protein
MSKGFSPFSMIGWNGTMISGTVACSSSGDDLGLVMSAMTNFERLATLGAKEVLPISQD